MIPSPVLVSTITFDDSNPKVIWLALATLGILLPVLTYRRIGLRTHRALTWGLLVLRAAGVSALILALSKSTWTTESEIVDPARLGVIIDDSASMTLSAGEGMTRFSRSKVAVHRLDDAVNRDPAPRVELSLFGLDGKPLPGDRVIQFNRDRTDLARPLASVAATPRTRPLAGLLLISDGMDNSGRTTYAELAELGIPVHTLGFPAPNDGSVKPGDARIPEGASLARLQRENRAQTSSGNPSEGLVTRQAKIRGMTRMAARAMEKNALPTPTIAKALDNLHAGLMARVLGGLESLRDTGDAPKLEPLRNVTLPIQDAIIAELDSILARWQKNEQARAALRRLAKTDKPAHDAIAKQLDGMVKDLSKLLDDRTELAVQFERLPKKGGDDTKDDPTDAAKELDEMRKAWNKWAKGAVNELAKLPSGFVGDFGLQSDVNKVFEEIKKAAQRSKAEILRGRPEGSLLRLPGQPGRSGPGRADRRRPQTWRQASKSRLARHNSG